MHGQIVTQPWTRPRTLLLHCGTFQQHRSHSFSRGLPSASRRENPSLSKSRMLKPDCQKHHDSQKTNCRAPPDNCAKPLPLRSKAHPCHPTTTKLLAEEAFAALVENGLPPATVQMIYNIAPEDGLRFVADPRLGAVGFTGSRAAGLKLKAAADAVGKPIYLEMSSLNPVVILPGALAERGAKIMDEFTGSCLMASGQFCTSPRLTILFAGSDTEQFIASTKAKLEIILPTTLLSSVVVQNLAANVNALQAAGA